MKDQKLTLATLLSTLRSTSERFQRYSFLLFIIFVSALYGFVLLRISSLSNTEPSLEAINTHVKAARVPKIDESIVKQLESLEDNSVSVQALFDQARQNPF